MSDSAAVEAEAVNYGAEFYPIGTAAAYAAKEDGKTVITIAISASRFQGQNFKYGGSRSLLILLRACSAMVVGAPCGSALLMAGLV